MYTNNDWKVFFEEIDNRAVDSLLNVAEESENIKQAIVIDKLLKDCNFMHYYKDLMVSEHLTDELPEEEVIISKYMTEILYHGLKNSKNEFINEMFIELNSDDKKFILLLMKKVLLSYGIKKYYENKYELCV
tara:strand:+ start:699 stop:1094 length:396 start_codon:yes stop_codon:yes gene_type:complete